MNILYTGALFSPDMDTSSCYGRMRQLDRLDHRTIPFCLLTYTQRWGRIAYKLSEHFLEGPLVRDYNWDLLQLAKRVRPDILWVDKGRWLRPNTLRKIKALGIQTIHYTPDPGLVFHASQLFRECIPLYDLIVTTKRYEVESYTTLGARRLLLQPPMYVGALHFPIEATPEEHRIFDCDVVFVGNYAKGREQYLAPLASLDAKVKIWGNGWERCRDPRIQPWIQRRGVLGHDYRLSVACAKIGLGLLSPLVPDRSTTRSMEIPAMGGFLLAQRTEEHQQLFVEGKEAEFFSSEQEVIEKVEYYLHEEEKRKTIASAGKRRCNESAYGSKEMLSEILDLSKSLPSQQVIIGTSWEPPNTGDDKQQALLT